MPDNQSTRVHYAEQAFISRSRDLITIMRRYLEGQASLSEVQGAFHVARDADADYQAALDAEDTPPVPKDRDGEPVTGDKAHWPTARIGAMGFDSADDQRNELELSGAFDEQTQ